MSDIKKGSCMCGEIKFECKGTPFSFSLCHCKMCRKFSGGPHGAFMGVKVEDFTYTVGESLVKVFTSSDWAKRSFCSQCGSSLMYLYNDWPDKYFVSAGLFDDDPGIKPQKHIFVKDKASWFDIKDDLEQIEKY